MLAETAAAIGDIQVRNRGTIGGSLAHADPGADYPAAMLALGAEITAVGSGGERTISASDFFVDILTTALSETEVITSVRVPAPRAAPISNTAIRPRATPWSESRPGWRWPAATSPVARSGSTE